jgi:hypothetical protein
VKPGRNASVTFEMRFEAYGEEVMKTKRSRVLSGINNSKRSRMSKSQMKIMLITSFSIKDIVTFEFIPQGKAVNQVYYEEILKWLHGGVSIKRPKLWPND